MTVFDRPDPDIDIVRLAQVRGTRREAMGMLYERFRERVFNVAYRIVGDRNEASDVLQDVFVLLFRKIHRYKTTAPFGSWVYRITVNVSLDHLRRRKRSPQPGISGLALDPPFVVEDLTMPERGVALRDLRTHVQTALESLSPRLRIVVVLRYLEDLSYTDIAEILGCSLGTVKSRLNRAHAALRSVLASRYDPGAAGERSA
jgi:RNA polymerase sigma-70 factor (ECF subfamily)